MNTVNNRRSQQTRSSLVESYLEILNQHPKEEVTVAELCRVTGINRSTFYAHFEDIAELHLSLVEETTHDIMALLQDPSYGKSQIGEERYAVLLEYVKEHRSFYLSTYLTGLMEESKVIDILTEKGKIHTEKQRIQAIFYRAGVNAVVKEWVLGGCVTDSKVLASYIAQFYRS